VGLDARLTGTGRDGKDLALRAAQDQSLVVSMTEGDVPPSGSPSRYRYFTKWLGSAGAEDTAADGGNADMGVDGSLTAQEFYVQANQNFETRISGIAIIIADTAVAHNSFGNVTALSTGWDLKVTESGEETFLINKAKTGGQVIAQAGFTSGYGNGATSWELTNWTTNEDAQTVYIPITEWIPGGIRLSIGSKDRLSSIVNDNLTGLTEMYVRVFGYRWFP